MITELALEAHRLALAIFGGGVAQVTTLERGVMTFKFTVTLVDRSRFVLRFYPASRTHVVQYEPDLFRRCAAHGISVPKMVTDSRSGPKATHAYCIYEYLEGIPLADRLPTLDEATVTHIAADLLRSLQMLQAVEVRGFGELIESRHARFNEWPEFLDTVFTEGIEGAVRSKLWPEVVLDELRELHGRIHMFPQPFAPTLALGDLSPENILIDTNNCFTGLLDLEGAVASEILLNAGYCYARGPVSPFFTALARAWPKRLTACDWDRINLYAIVRALSIARFTDQPLPSGLPRMPIERLLPGVGRAIKSLRSRL